MGDTLQHDLKPFEMASIQREYVCLGLEPALYGKSHSLQAQSGRAAAIADRYPAFDDPYAHVERGGGEIECRLLTPWLLRDRAPCRSGDADLLRSRTESAAV
jgi:hypothetical protein